MQKDGKEKLLSVINNNLLELAVNQLNLEKAALIDFMVNMRRIIANLYAAKSTKEASQTNINWFTYYIKNFVEKIKNDKENHANSNKHLSFLSNEIMMIIMQEYMLTKPGSDEFIEKFSNILMNSRSFISGAPS